MNLLLRGVIFFFTFYGSYASASPTSNEFVVCHQIAAHLLQTCLDKRPGYIDDACWIESKRGNAVCYARVKESHQPPDRAKVEAMKKAREKESLERR